MKVFARRITLAQKSGILVKEANRQIKKGFVGS